MATSNPLPLPSNSSTRPRYVASRSIENLRALAQSHLSEIEAELADEHSDRLARNLQLQLYAKQPRQQGPPTHQLRHQGIKSTSHPHSSTKADETSTASPPPPPPETKLPKLRTASDVLHRLQHDPDMNVQEYVIGYLERFDGMLEMPVSKWVRESTDEEFIPQHRIRYIIRRRQGDDEMVWGRDERVDLVFGSGN